MGELLVGGVDRMLVWRVKVKVWVNVGIDTRGSVSPMDMRFDEGDDYFLSTFVLLDAGCISRQGKV